MLSWHKTPALNTQNIHRTLPMKKSTYITVYFIEILRCTCLELKFLRFYFISVYCDVLCTHTHTHHLWWCDDRKSISELSSYHQKWKAAVRIVCVCVTNCRHYSVDWEITSQGAVMAKQSNRYLSVLSSLIVLGSFQISLNSLCKRDTCLSSQETPSSMTLPLLICYLTEKHSFFKCRSKLKNKVFYFCK